MCKHELGDMFVTPCLTLEAVLIGNDAQLGSPPRSAEDKGRLKICRKLNLCIMFPTTLQVHEHDSTVTTKHVMSQRCMYAVDGA